MDGMRIDGPTPWWQLPNTDVGNLDRSAPDGYTYDRVKMRYVPKVGSAPDQLTQRNRSQGIEDQMLHSAMSGLSTANGGVHGTGVGEGGGGGVTLPPATTGPAWQSITGPTQATQDANESAVFGKVKDNAANTAQAAMRGLSESLGQRGMSGGGYEGGQIGGTLARESNQIGEGVRQWAGQRYADENHRADVNTNAGITARGQDLSAASAARGQDLGAGEANLSAGTARRGQDMYAQTAANQQRLSALSGLSRSLAY